MKNGTANSDQEATVVKNLFRLRNAKVMEMLENDDFELNEPADVGAADASVVGIAELVLDGAPHRKQPDPAPVGSKAPYAAVGEVTEPVPSQTVEPQRPAAAAANGARPWVTQYLVPEVEAIQAKIQELEKQILELKTQKAELEKKANEREVLRNTLLTGTGLSLKQAVEYAFGELGVSVRPGSPDQMDLVLEHKGQEYVVKITASEGPISLTDIRQLNHRVEDFIEASGREPKGLLIANPLVSLPLDERFANGHVAFPEDLRLLAQERYRFCLMTTPQLFVVYCKFKEGQLNIGEFMTELFETSWVYRNHQDYDHFKKQ
jgi:hypothetical protein